VQQSSQGNPFELRRLIVERFRNLHTHNGDVHCILDEIITGIMLYNRLNQLVMSADGRHNAGCDPD
jgi:hypothetical protein